MSVRAYPIKKIDFGGCAFNLWHDKYIVDLLNQNGFFDLLTEDGTGIAEISPFMLDDMEKQFRKDLRAGLIDKDEEKRIKEVLGELRKNARERKKRGDGGYVSYYCF